MKVLTVPAIFILMISLIGCAPSLSLHRRAEKETIQVESPGEKDDMMRRLKALDESVSNLRSSLNLLQSDGERWKTLEASISALRSEVAALQSRLNNLQTRPPLTAFKLPGDMSLCGERIPLSDRNVWENLDREFLTALNNEAQILLWMKRARRYFSYIEKRLMEMGLPDDLKYVTITESSLRPEVVSSSGACGIWQFIPSTGEKYGMRRDRGIDERYDFFKATEGALTYLKGLHEEFKSWTLAMAAYNAGENRVRKEIELQKTENYFQLNLPLETERYVYKIVAAKIILSDPGRYGVHLGEEDYYSPLNVERVQIELIHPLPISSIAQAIGRSYKEVKEMNPHLLEEKIPAGAHFLNLPPGTSERFLSFLSNWKKDTEIK